MVRLITIVAALSSLLLSCSAAQAPNVATSPPVEATAGALTGRLESFLSRAEGEAILARTERVELEADLSSLTPAETQALVELEAVGELFHRLYEESCHPDADRVRRFLETFQPRGPEVATLAVLRDLFWMFRGPIVTDLAGERVPISLEVSAYEPTRNIYPIGAGAEELRAYASAHPEAGLLELRSLVRRRTDSALAADLAQLASHPALELLHPALRERLEAPADPEGYYAVPYSLAYAEAIFEAQGRLQRAAALVRADDEDLADYLEQRARDLLTDDYEAGDAAWISGRTRRLNAQIGAYETYDDHLLGLRAFFSLSILIRDSEASAELEQATSHLPELAAALPGGPYDPVRAAIPIGIYDVHADYGQARGGNTATILPNEARLARRYGRTILIRRNILTNPALLAIDEREFRAVVAPAHASDLGPTGSFDRTVYHEVGHYLGPRQTTDGRSISEALGNLHNHLEELKSDLMSLWMMPRLVELGVLDEARARAAFASGVLRTMVVMEPGRERPYLTMMLMQQNYFLDGGVLRFDAESGTLGIDYGRFHEVVTQMLSEVLALQRRGDPAAAAAFVDRWARWDDAVQGVLGHAVDQAAPRYRLIRYRAQRTPTT